MLYKVTVKPRLTLCYFLVAVLYILLATYFICRFVKTLMSLSRTQYKNNTGLEKEIVVKFTNFSTVAHSDWHLGHVDV